MFKKTLLGSIALAAIVGILSSAFKFAFFNHSG